MKKLMIALCFVLPLTTEARAKEKCLPAEKVSMQEAADLKIPQTDFSVGICYRPEKKRKDGTLDDNYQDSIILKSRQKVLTEAFVPMPVTVGRLSNLVFEMASSRYVAVSYDAGEACNGLVVFDTRLNKTALQQGCVSPTETCHVVELNKKACEAKLECKDEGAEDAELGEKKPVVRTVRLCR